MSGARTRRLVIGVGNPERGDDAAGRAVARLLPGTLPADVEIAEGDGEATSLLAQIEACGTAVLVDASASGAPAGTVRRFDVAAAPLPQDAGSLSSHGLGLATAIELARALGQLPPRCVVYAIEGASFTDGEPLSPAVAAAVDDVAGRLRAEFGPPTATEG